MKTAPAANPIFPRSGATATAGMAVAAGLSAVVLARYPPAVWIAVGLLALVLLVAAAFRSSTLLIALFISSLILVPPVYLGSGQETPVYLSNLFLPIVLLVLIFRWPDLRLHWDAVCWGLLIFLLGTAASLPFAWWFSGADGVLQGGMRWLLLAQTLPVYLLIRGNLQRGPNKREISLLTWFTIAAALSAAYGVYDFFYPVPITHPAAEQWVWMGSGTMQRAQGIFYEATTYANFCNFFLLLTASAYLVGREKCLRLPAFFFLPLTLLFALGLLLGFSRASWGSWIVSMAVMIPLARPVRMRRALVLLALGVGIFAVLAIQTPDLWDYLVKYRLGSLGEIFSDPSFATSWRLGTWRRLFAIMENHPAYLLLGIGYKTLQFTNLFHGTLVTDNGYLNLLMETGVTGLATFLIFLGSVLGTFWRISKSASGSAAHWSKVVFAFWCGECVQLLAADAYTFWRNMLVFVAVMALTMNMAACDSTSRYHRGFPEQP